MSGGALFLTGTGTDIGKTYVATLLLRTLAAAGRPTHALKPVASGIPPADTTAFADSDIARLLVAQGRPVDADAIARCTPWRFTRPLSPDLAAVVEGRSLHVADVIAFCRDALARSGDAFTLIEGVGGIMSPLAADGLNLDLAAALGIPVALVAGTYLGAISHTLSALSALRGRGLATVVVIVNETPGAATSCEDTCEIVSRFDDGARTVPLRREASLSPLLLDMLGAR